MQHLPYLLSFPLEPMYDVNIHERPSTKSAILGQTGYTEENVTNEEFSRTDRIVQGLSTR
jgi:hypothetical protein